MEMSIEDIIQELERTKDYPANDPASDEALDGAIEIIHKYQKIEQIVKQYKKFGNIDFSMQIISGVVEDEVGSEEKNDRTGIYRQDK